MKNNILNKIFRTIAFLLCAVTVFSIVSMIYERKTYKGEWNYMAKLKEFYEMPEDSIDYIVVGSSHAYCSVNPLEIWNDSGISGFVLATQQQPLRASYHYIKEAFKTQSPKYVILEGYMVVGGEKHDEGVLYDAIDPLKMSVNKIQLVNSLITDRDDRPNYYFNILKYHSRWQNVTLDEAKLAFDNKSDIYKGFVALNRTFAAQNQAPDYDNIEANMYEGNVDILNDILELTTKNGAELVVIIAPYEGTNEKLAAPVKALKEWANENNVESIDYSLMLDELGIDPANDYFDGSHLDISGALKISTHLSQYLKDKGLSVNPNARDYEWRADLNTYRAAFGLD